HGGIRLARPADQIGVGAVVRAMETDLALVECQAGVDCTIGGICRLQRMLDEAQGAMMQVLDKYTLADVATPASTALRRRLGVSD
ncbi:MAG: Rrf2 family transcriptional regulator, partial [Acidocella sp. 20-61-6]